MSVKERGTQITSKRNENFDNILYQICFEEKLNNFLKCKQ